MFASLHTSTLAVGRVERRGVPGLLTRLRAAMAVHRAAPSPGRAG
jgi:hypothetical protein